MDRKAARRIKDGTGTGLSGGRSASASRWRSRFFQFFLVSVLAHAAAGAVIWQYSSPEKPARVVELINIAVAPLPGPAGGGGKSEDIEQPKEPPKKEEVPEKEPVKVESKLVEKAKPEPKKEPEKVEAPKPQPEMPAGPGQGPVGGGGKKVDEALTGPIAVEGGINSPLLMRYLGRLSGPVDVRWKNKNTAFTPTKRWQPKAVLYFIIDKNGKIDISRVEIKERSGNITYDNLAVSVIREVVKQVSLGPLPPGIKGDTIGIYYTFKVEEK